MKVRFTPLMLALLLFLTAGDPAVAQDQKSPTFVDNVDITTEVVTFQTKKGHYVDFTMKVAGPDDYWMQYSFTGEEMPSLRVKMQEGALLPDGSYTIEVTARPMITDEQRAALDQARQKGDRYEIRKLMKEIGYTPEANVHATYLTVAEGKFVTPLDVEEQKGTGQTMGAVETPRNVPQIQSIELTGQRWDTAYLPNQVANHAAADATGAAAQNALLVSDGNAPPFAQAGQAPTWYEAAFQNTNDDGTSLTYQGYVRPVAYDGSGKLFQAYFRQTNAAGEEAWFRGFFLAENGVYRFLSHAEVTRPAQAAPLFDYVAQDDPAGGAPEAALPDQVILDDLIVDGSICAGFDCVNGESFGFDTLRLKENNLRIKGQDTSSSASFPTQDWQITFNDTSNGGANKFSIDAIAPSTGTPFTIEAGAPSHSLYVDDGGRIGRKTSTPVVQFHMVDGNTPTVRLEQDGSSGFGAQTWDMAGNEANFFIRDATNGSTLPFRIFPGAPSNALTIEGSTGDIGIGTTSPDGEVHVIGQVLIDAASDQGVTAAAPLHVRNDGTNQNVMVVRNSALGNNIFRIFEDGNGAGLYSALDQNGTEVVRLNSAQGGELSIGCASADHDLDIAPAPGADCSTGASRSFIDAGSTTFTASSSRLLKENIVPMQVNGLLDKIAGVGVYQYDFIDGGKNRLGLMAEDFHQIFGRGSDKLLDGQEVQMALWMAVQQLTERNEALTAQNDELMQRLARIEARLGDQ